MKKVTKSAEGAPPTGGEEESASRKRVHSGVVRQQESVRGAKVGAPNPAIDQGEETRRRMLMKYGPVIVRNYRDTTREQIERGVVITLFDLDGRVGGIRQIVERPKKRGVSDVRVGSVARGAFRWAFPDKLPEWLADALRSPIPIPDLVVCLAEGGVTAGRLIYRPRLRQWVLVPGASGRPRIGSVIPIVGGLNEEGAQTVKQSTKGRRRTGNQVR